MVSRTIVTLLALVVGIVVLLAACQNPGPTVVMQVDPLQPLGEIVPITAEGDGPWCGCPRGRPCRVRHHVRHLPHGRGRRHVRYHRPRAQPHRYPWRPLARTSAPRSTFRQSIEEPTAFIAPEYTPLMTAGLKDALGGDFEGRGRLPAQPRVASRGFLPSASNDGCATLALYLHGGCLIVHQRGLGAGKMTSKKNGGEPEEQLTFEAAYQRLEQTVQALEAGD